MTEYPRIRIAASADQPGIFALVQDLYTDFGYVASQNFGEAQYSRAHRFFEKSGFTLTDRIREMHDGLQPYQERFCFLDLE